MLSIMNFNLRVAVLAAATVLIFTGGAADAQSIQDSSNLDGSKVRHSPIVTVWDSVRNKPATATRWPRWSEVTEKPDMATRWPSWNEVTGKPSAFKPEAHHHDSRYIRRDTSGSIAGNLSVSGTVTGNRLVTGDVGGDRWCRANSAGRVQCTHSAPTGGASIDGWPVSLRCGSAIWTLMGVGNTEISYRGCGGGKSTRCDIMRYDKETGDYKGRETYGGAWNTGCNVNFHSIPASHKG